MKKYILDLKVVDTQQLGDRYVLLKLTSDTPLPEMIPGRFITIANFGTAVSNQFYVYSVQHRMLSDGSYEMKVVGKSSKMQAALPGV